MKVTYDPEVDVLRVHFSSVAVFESNEDLWGPKGRQHAEAMVQQMNAVIMGK